MKTLLRDAGIAFTASNIFLLRSWLQVENIHNPVLWLFLPGPPRPKFELTVLLAMSMLAVVGFCWLRLERRLTPSFPKIRMVSIGILALLLFDLSRNWTSDLYLRGYPLTSFLLSAVVCATLTIILYRGLSKASMLIEVLVLIITPAFVYRAGETLYYSLAGPGDSTFSSSRSILPTSWNRAKPRLVWILFDEMDESLISNPGPERANLPEFDRLKQESLSCHRAIPSAGSTLLAVTSMVTGKFVEEVLVSNPPGLLLQMQNGTEESLPSGQKDLFSELHDLGYSIAVAGWHFPYCQLFWSQIDWCYSEAALPGAPSEQWYDFVNSLNPMQGAWELVLHNSSQVFSTFGRSFLPAITQRQNVRKYLSRQRRLARKYLNVRVAALRYVADERVGFALIHLPVPHPPPIYDSARGEVASEVSNDYIDNLMLCDRFLGEARSALENRGLWESTTLLVSSDHSFRPSLWRDTVWWSAEMEQVSQSTPTRYVPFILKMAGQNSRVEYLESFNTIVVFDLMLGLARGGLQHPDDVVRLLDSRREQDRNGSAR